MAHLTKISSTTRPWSALKADLFAVGLFENKVLTAIGREVDQALGGQISRALERGDLKGKAGDTALFYGTDQRVLVVGLGKEEKFDHEALRRAGGTVAKFGLKQKLPRLACETLGGDGSAAAGQALAEGLVLGSYQFLDYKTAEQDNFQVTSAQVVKGSRAGLKRGRLIAGAVGFARDLANHPGNVTTPSRLAEAAREIATTGGMKLTVFDREKFTALGMGALAGVAAGTAEEPKFILLEYSRGDKRQPPVALVGKGLTFDSGGISIKPSKKMDEMKFDMCGAALVLGVMRAVAELQPRLNIVAAIPATENLSGARAYKPGDILTAYNGKTIEVLNTDAEGRLILADALSYVCKHFNPQYVLDFATLTGAVIVALGHEATGIMGTDEDLLRRVQSSADRSGERVWQLPLWDEYCEHVKSKIADVKNMGQTGQAGTIAGAAFLKEFVSEGTSWVHFDIAGSAWGGKEKAYTTKAGASGTGIRLVLDLLEV